MSRNAVLPLGGIAARVRVHRLGDLAERAEIGQLHLGGVGSPVARDASILPPSSVLASRMIACLQRRAHRAHAGDGAGTEGQTGQQNAETPQIAAQVDQRDPHPVPKARHAGERPLWRSRSDGPCSWSACGPPSWRGCGSCVISRTAVFFLRARLNISSMTLAPVSWSRLPVGSSASISVGLRHHGAGEAHALLLAARQRARQMGDAVAQPHFLQRGLRLLADFLVGLPGLGDLERQRDIFERRHRGNEVEVLEQDAEAVAAEDRQLVLVRRRNVLPGDDDLARRRAFESARIISSEVLPLPDGPTTAVTSPLFTWNVTSLRMCSMDLPLISSRFAFSVWMTGTDIDWRARVAYWTRKRRLLRR